MASRFDKKIDRWATGATKWAATKDPSSPFYTPVPQEDVIPMWVADMDFETAPSVIEALKERVILQIDKNADRIVKIGEDIRENPEMGYKENKTAAYVKDEFLKLGLGVEDGLALTGIKGTMKGKNSIANVAVIGELDAVSLLFGNPTTFIYSIAGAMLSIVVMIVLKKLNFLSAVGVSVAGGVFHNVGQILVAMLLLGTTELAYYMIALAVFVTVSGILIGLCAALMIKKIPMYKI